MDLRQKLLLETQALHKKIEQTGLLRKIVNDEITLLEYQLLLTQFYAFIFPCEKIISQLSCKQVIENREKTHLLQRDLIACSGSPREVQFCQQLPALKNRYSVLGYLYVFEGSTLGGQIIIKLIKKRLLITPQQGGSFFYGYGDKTQFMWKSFCQQLNSIADPKAKAEILDSAYNTYDNFYQWLNQN